MHVLRQSQRQKTLSAEHLMLRFCQDKLAQRKGKHRYLSSLLPLHSRTEPLMIHEVKEVVQADLEYVGVASWSAPERPPPLVEMLEIEEGT